MKKGEVRWTVMIWNGKIDWSEWVCRTIRGGKATFIDKNSVTWGKLSKKHGDFGWLKSIPSYCRRTCRIDGRRLGDPVRGRLFTTKPAAVRAEIRGLKGDLRQWGEYEPYEIADNGGKSLAEQIKQLENWLKRNQRRVTS